MIVVSDTFPITNLAAIGHLELLKSLYGQILLPTEVYGEMVGIGKTVPGTQAIQSFAWIQTQSVMNQWRIQTLQTGRENIDLGEASAIVLALEANADLLLIDERRGRTVALKYGLNVMGLLGILIQAKALNRIPYVKPLVDQLIEQANFRVNAKLYAKVLEVANER